MHLELILSALKAAPGVNQWQVTETVERRWERYLANGAVLTKRRTGATRWQVWLALAGRDGVHGEAGFTIGAAEDADALVARVDGALAAAAAAANPVWALPGPGEPWTALPPGDPDAGCDPQVLADPESALDSLVADSNAALSADVRAGSLELFATVTERRLINHRGLDLRDRRTRLDSELILLHQPAGGREGELIDRAAAARLADLALGQRSAAAATWVRDVGTAIATPAGTTAVLLTAEAAASLWGYYAHHADAAQHARGVAAFRLGSAVLTRRSGPSLNLASDPTVPSLSGYSFDNEGYAPRRAALLEADRVVGIAGAGRWMQALGLPPCGAIGTLVVPPGPVPLTELRKNTLEIVRFSEFSPRDDTGSFSGEIRLGYLHRADGSRVAVRGGSISGTMAEAMAAAMTSSECITVADYHGPAAIRLEGIRVAG